MFSKTHEPEAFPGSKVTLRPLTGPLVWDLERSQFGGTEIYAAFRFAVSDWSHAPLLGDEFCEKFDPMMIEQLKPGFVLSVVVEALTSSSLTEEERKNS